MARKFWMAVVLMLVIESALYFWAGSGVTKTSLFTLILNPLTFNPTATGTFYGALAIAMGIFAASAIIPGSFININIYALYAAIGLVILSFIMHLGSLFTFIHGELGTMPGLEATSLIVLIEFVLMAPLIIFYMTAMAEWVRSNT